MKGLSERTVRPSVDQGPRVPARHDLARRRAGRILRGRDGSRRTERPRDSWQPASPYLDAALDLPPKRAGAATTRAPTRRRQIRAAALAERLSTRRLPRAPPRWPTRPRWPAHGRLPLAVPLGHGGMGGVWMADDRRSLRRPRCRQALERGAGRAPARTVPREGRLLARLTSRDCAPRRRRRHRPWTPYLVLEYVEGRPSTCARRPAAEAGARCSSAVLRAGRPRARQSRRAPGPEAVQRVRHAPAG